ncbi:NIN-like protein [Artemisia annua]|uniref:NIN-like protein n=1 Tax=Artemisia annua TaxID=35608 RepID=A0A2U1MPJ4_ARTAN|nr:NIN-like protein [Artemisia annua]
MKQSIGGLNYAKDEIEKALEIVCESHNLILAQVWFPFDKTHVVKLTDHYVFGTERYDVPSNNAKYCYICDMLPLKNGEGLVWKTLQTYEPHFCRDTSKMSGSGLLWQLSTLTKCSIFMICLRSIDTGDLDYVFEFLWPQSRNYFVMLQTLLSTLKGCLPIFKFASGAEIGDELHITDVENSTGTGIGFFKIFEENRLSLWKKEYHSRGSLSSGFAKAFFERNDGIIFG